VLGAQPERIIEVARLLAEPKQGQPIPFWDGNAGRRAAEAVARLLEG
jgi:hypothetical protein